MSEEFEKRLRVYLAENQRTYLDIATALNITTKTLRRVRKGEIPVTMRQGYILSEILDMNLIDLYDILPECNHEDVMFPLPTRKGA